MNRQKWFLGGAVAVMAAMATGCGAPGPERDPVVAVGAAVESGPLAARPDSVDFGRIPVGVDTRQAVSLVNTGADTVDISMVTSIPDYPPDPCRPILIQPCIRPGDSTTLTIDCAPTTAGAVGDRVDIAYASGRVAYHLALPYSGLAY